MDESIFLIIKDAHHADDTLVEFLREIHSVQSDLALLAVLVDDESDDFRSAEMQEFVKMIEEELKLAPLDHLAISKLIEEKAWAPPNPKLANWVHAVSEGHPLHASLLVDYLAAQNLTRQDMELSWRSSPPNERPGPGRLHQSEIRSLERRAHAVSLEAAAVLGKNFRLSTLNAITYHHEDELDEALGRGGQFWGLGTRQSGGAISYHWKHPKFRQTLLKKLPPGVGLESTVWPRPSIPRRTGTG